MATVYKDEDADPSLLAGKEIVILGYGSQGRAQALNLRDAGFDVQIAVRPGKSFERAREDFFEPLAIVQAAKAAVLVFCLPDIEAGKVFIEEIRTRLLPGTTLVFAHGFAIQYGLVRPPDDVDAVLVAPMGAGPVVRKRFVEGSGVPALLAVHQDSSGEAWEMAKAYGSALGCGRQAMLATTFQEETESDLFGEQAVLCGGLPYLMREAYRALVEGGIQPEIAYIACVHEVKLIVDLIYERGLDGMAANISQTAEWGAYKTGPSVIGVGSRDALQEAFKGIREGRFAREWIHEAANGSPELKERRSEYLADPIHSVGAKVRKLMGIE